MASFKNIDVSIFIVDDDELLTKILRTKFSQNNSYKVYSFSSGEDFLSFYYNYPKSKKHIHILIIDYLLKPNEPTHLNKNGIDFSNEAKRINPDIKTIVISGVDDSSIAKQAEENGAVAFIKKNENSFLRINNQINFIISETQLHLSHKKSLFFKKIFFAFLIVFLLFIVYIFVSNFLEN